MFAGLPSSDCLGFSCVNFVACITGRGTAAQRRRGRPPRAAAAPQQRASGAARWRPPALALPRHRQPRSRRHSPRRTCRCAEPRSACRVRGFGAPPHGGRPHSRHGSPRRTCRRAESCRAGLGFIGWGSAAQAASCAGGVAARADMQARYIPQCSHQDPSVPLYGMSLGNVFKTWKQYPPGCVRADGGRAAGVVASTVLQAFCIPQTNGLCRRRSEARQWRR